MFFAFAALVALVAAQCNPEGNTYTDGAGNTLTFGAAVTDWVPSLFNPNDVNSVIFSTWKQATATRWTVSEFGSSSTVNWDTQCATAGQYSFFWASGCDQLTITRIYDYCPTRPSFLEQTWTVVARPDGASCISAGTSLTTTFGTDPQWNVLSNLDVTYVFGANEFALASVGDQAVIVQRWREDAAGHNVDVVDLGSFPLGFACAGTEVGNYFHVTSWGGDQCSVRLCGLAETCVNRANLLNGAPFNGYQGDVCSNTIQLPPVAPTQCSDGRQWLKHPDQCTAQAVEGGCAFCQGVAMGEITSWCINREGAKCNDIFNSPTSETFCNMAFECPASTATVSFLLFISAVLALVFF